MYPVYRKLSDKNVYYKIISEAEFEEVMLMGKYYFINTLKATQYPEKLRIMDMVNLNDNSYLDITEKEFDEFMHDCKKNYIRKSF